MPRITCQLSQHGPVLKALICVSAPHATALSSAGKTVPKRVLANALIDTGASRTNIDSSIVKQLGLSSKGTAKVLTPSTTAGNPHTAKMFDVSIEFRSPNSWFGLGSIQVIEADFTGQGIQVLVGRDILSQCVLWYDGQAGIFTIAH